MFAAPCFFCTKERLFFFVHGCVFFGWYWLERNQQLTKMENINHLCRVFMHLRCRFLWREVMWGDNNPVQMAWVKLFEVQGESVDGHNEVSLKYVYKSYHFSHNHGSVGNHLKWKETIVIMGGRVDKYQRLKWKNTSRTHLIGGKWRLIDESMIPSLSKLPDQLWIRSRVIPGTPIYLGILMGVVWE